MAGCAGSEPFGQTGDNGYFCLVEQKIANFG